MGYVVSIWVTQFKNLSVFTKRWLFSIGNYSRTRVENAFLIANLYDLILYVTK